jgi:mannose-6-phosphate isomerase-like protein (cupin superfamily)
MRYFIDLDNTLCQTTHSDYINSRPIQIRIDRVNRLKKEGHFIAIWTARGSTSGIDHRELTVQQLAEWGVQYDELIMGKPNYDVYIDDKSFNVNSTWRSPSLCGCCEKDSGNIAIPKIDACEQVPAQSRTDTAEIVQKGWGHEIIFANNPEYCGKVLVIEKNKGLSMHYHLQKKETWFIEQGRLLMSFIDTKNGTLHSCELKAGDTVTNERGEPHELYALESSRIFEVSTTHFDTDSYRIWKGN